MVISLPKWQVTNLPRLRLGFDLALHRHVHGQSPHNTSALRVHRGCASQGYVLFTFPEPYLVER